MVEGKITTPQEDQQVGYDSSLLADISCAICTLSICSTLQLHTISFSFPLFCPIICVM